MLVTELLDILVPLFERVGLRTNTDKTQAMICVPCRIRVRLSAASYARRSGLEGSRAWMSRRVECDKCGGDFAASSLPSHLETQHGVFCAEVLEEEYLEARPARTYRAHQSADGVWRCPAPDCVGESRTKWTLRRHFRDRHPLDFVDVPGEGVYRKCENCGMQTSPQALGRGHEGTRMCQEGGVRRRQQEARVNAALALRRQFEADGDALERVEVFKYLGRLLSQHDDDAQAVRANLGKARKSWARVSRVLRGENASPRVCGVFYRAIVQAVLLYGSESWVLTPALLDRLEGFHIRAAWRMAVRHKPRRTSGGEWVYPRSEKARKEAGLQTMEHYLQKRRDTIAAWVVDRPLLAACKGGERRRGTPRHTWWWEQEFSLDEESPDRGDSSDGDSSSEEPDSVGGAAGA